MENQEVYHIKPGVKEIVITHKKGLDEIKPLPLHLKGNIDSVFTWLDKKPEESAHVLIDRDKMRIILIFDRTPGYFFQDMIEGLLEYHPDFRKWGINEGEEWDNDKLAEFIKMNRSCFKSKSEAMTLSSELKNLKVKVDKQIEANNDNRGSVKVMAAQNVIESSIPKSFKLNVSIFKGQPKQEFEVEVYVNPNNFHVTLVSPDANDLIEEVRDNIIDKQKEIIKAIAPAIPIIEQ
jgi:hypothetical protein